MKIKLNQFLKALAFLICAVVTTSTVSGQIVQPKTRTIIHQPGVSIKAQLRPDDQILRVSRTVHGTVGNETPTVAQEIQYAVGVSDAVVRAKLTDAIPQLIEDGSWIATRLVFSAGQILAGDLKLPPSFSVVWTGGGTLSIDKILVQAGSDWPLQVGAELLMFLGRNPETGELFNARTPLWIDGNQVFSPWYDKKSALDVLNGQPLGQIEAYVASKK